MHFGRAADRLQIAQPPLARLIGRVEADVGTRLIDLTQAGKALLARAREIVRQIDEAT